MVAVSDCSGGRHEECGLDIASLLEHKAGGGAIASSGGVKPENEELLALPADVLAPCALEGVLDASNAGPVKAGNHHRRRERPDIPGGRRNPRGDRRPRRSGRARERGRGRRLVLRMGRGPAGAALGRGRGQRASRKIVSMAYGETCGATGGARDLDADGGLWACRPARRGRNDDPWPLPLMG